jgi:thiamine-monophosphate kinase
VDDRELLTIVREVAGDAQTFDDCAVIQLGSCCAVITTDMLHASTDFPRGITCRQAGWMAVAVTLSDIAAMGAAPRYILLAVGLDQPRHLKKILEGAVSCAERFGASVVGGDLDAHTELTLVSTGIGLVDPRSIVRRSGANPGDVIAITGTPGRAQAALVGYTQFACALYEPIPAVMEGIALGKAGASAMMDVSDGLALSLYDLLDANDCGFSIYTAMVPLPPEVPLDEAREFALYGGGDFGLLFSIPPGLLVDIGISYTVIGTVISDRAVLLDGDPMPKRGYVHQWNG